MGWDDAMRLIMVVPTLGKRCGISDYSMMLAKALQDRYSKRDSGDSAPLDISLVVFDPTSSLWKGLKGSDTVVHFQYQYVLYSLEKLHEILKTLRTAGIAPVVTMHEFSAEYRDHNRFVLTEFHKVVTFSPLMRDLLLRVHPPGQYPCANSLIRRGSPLVEVIQMPCDDQGLRDGLGADGPGSMFHKAHEDLGSRARRNLGLKARQGLGLNLGLDVRESHGPTSEPCIAAFGFMLPHKGFINLIRAISILREKVPGIHCFIFAPEAPYISSRNYRIRVEEEIRRLRAESYVHLSCDYLPRRRVIEHLAAMDLVILPYEDRGMLGVSSAARLALSALRPLIVTDTPFFHDLGHEVIKIPSSQPAVIAEAVNRVINDKQAMDQYVERIARFVRCNSWASAADKHLDLYLGGLERPPETPEIH